MSIGERETIALGEPMIFSNKVDAGWREENASKQAAKSRS